MVVLEEKLIWRWHWWVLCYMLVLHCCVGTNCMQWSAIAASPCLLDTMFHMFVPHQAMLWCKMQPARHLWHRVTVILQTKPARSRCGYSVMTISSRWRRKANLNCNCRCRVPPHRICCSITEYRLNSVFKYSTFRHVLNTKMYLCILLSAELLISDGFLCSHTSLQW